MEANKDTALECIDRAEQAITEGRYEQAEKLLNKAQRLFETDKAKGNHTTVTLIP